MDELASLQESTPKSFSRSSFGALIADSMLSSASDRTRVGAALWLIHVENLTKRRDKRFGVLRAGECGNAVDDKERHAVA
jgi:hypothetical protein